MSYEEFKERIGRERRNAVLPRIPHDDPRYIWAPSRSPLKADLLAHILGVLGDDPQQAIQGIERLRDDPKLQTEARDFYEKKVQELRREISQ